MRNRGISCVYQQERDFLTTCRVAAVKLVGNGIVHAEFAPGADDGSRLDVRRDVTRMVSFAGDDSV